MITREEVFKCIPFEAAKRALEAMRRDGTDSCSREELFEAVDEKGAELAAAVFAFMQRMDPVEAVARALIAYGEWMKSQPCEDQLLHLVKMTRLIKQMDERRAALKGTTNG